MALAPICPPVLTAQKEGGEFCFCSFFCNPNYYFDFAVCLSVCVYVRVCPKKIPSGSTCHFRCKFGEQTSRILEFKPKVLEG